MNGKILLFAAVFILLSCISDSPIENNRTKKGMFGHVVLEDGSPAEGAVVELMTAARSLGKKARTVIAIKIAGQEGDWVFTGLKSGAYNLSAIYKTSQRDTLGAFAKGLAFDSDSLLNLGTIQLTRTGSVRTVIVANTKPAPEAKCAIPGTPYSTFASKEGECLLTGVPAGKFDIFYSYGSYTGRSDGIQVEAGTQKNLGIAVLLPDSSLPPPPPWGLNSTYDRKSGVVILSWQPVPVPDLKGYKLFRKNSISNEPIPLNNGKLIQGTVFRDTVFMDLQDTSSVIYAYWIISEDSGGARSASELFIPVTATAPDRPSMAFPKNGSRNVNPSSVLSWTGIQPAEGEKVIYNIFLDTVPEAATPVSRNQTGTWLTLSNLRDSTLYYWRVAANRGDTTVMGPVWSFTTRPPLENNPPHTPSLKFPVDGAANVNPATELEWEGGDPDGDSLIYDVFLSMDSTFSAKYTSVSDSRFKVNRLNAGTLYYWRVVALDSKSQSASNVECFTVKSKPDKPLLKGPSAGSRVSGYTQTLSWQGGGAQGDTLNYRVFLGLDSSFDGEYANTAKTAINVSNLAPHRTYFWKVVADNGAYQVTSDISSFRLVGRRIRMNTTKSGARIFESVDDFPVAVKLHGENFNFADAHPRGQDVRFTKADGKALSFEIERWDIETQMAEIWVKLDTVKKNDSTQYFLMYWGDGKSGNSSGGPAVFDASNGFRMVYHMDSVGQNSIDSARKDVYRNSVQDVFHGEDHTSSPSMEGIIGEGRNFQENNDYINLGTPNISGEALTISLWVKANDFDNRCLVSKATGEWPNQHWWMLSFVNTNRLMFRLNTGNNTTIASSSTNALSAKKWTFVAARYDGSAMRLFKYAGTPSDGEVGSERKSGNLSASSQAEVWIGNDPGSDNRAHKGHIDEVRISAAARSAAWLKLCYESQKEGSQFLRMED